MNHELEEMRKKGWLTTPERKLAPLQEPTPRISPLSRLFGRKKPKEFSPVEEMNKFVDEEKKKIETICSQTTPHPSVSTGTLFREIEGMKDQIGLLKDIINEVMSDIDQLKNKPSNQIQKALSKMEEAKTILESGQENI